MPCPAHSRSKICFPVGSRSPDVQKRSVNSFPLSEKISALTTKNYLEQRAKRADQAAFRGILEKVPDRTPLPGDEVAPDKL